jgi:hypothetical protein
MIAPENDPTPHTKPVIYTIGHSTHPREEFLAILKAHAIELVADVRTIPKSRHNPQFNSEAMAMSLPENGIAYQHVQKPGDCAIGEIHRTWDGTTLLSVLPTIQTADFEEGLESLIAIAQNKDGDHVRQLSLAVSSDADRRRAAGPRIAVIDIISASSVKAHSLTHWAKVVGSIITYPKN